MAETVIYGMGNRGMELYFYFRFVGRNVSCFIDNSTMKHCNNVLANVSCISYDVFKERYPKKTEIIVSMNNPTDIIRDLNNDGFFCLRTHREFELEMKKMSIVVRNQKELVSFLEEIKTEELCFPSRVLDNSWQDLRRRVTNLHEGTGSNGY